MRMTYERKKVMLAALSEKMRSSVLFFVVAALLVVVLAKKAKEKPDWAKKDIRDYSDADMERLLEQWEEDDDPLEEDELPEHLRPMPQIDMTKLDPSDPQGLLEATKKGRTLMTFVSVSGKPTREETETLTKLWQTSLWNSHIQAERYLVDDNRAIFLFKDGAQAWSAKNYLVEQEKCEGVTIEGKVYHGKHSGKKERDEL